MGNTFGQLFCVTTFGESHGGGIGVVIDGCPPRIEISEAEIQRELDRRRPGQSKLTTQRKEEDRCEILSGVFEGRTLGTPIAILVRNKDARPEDYAKSRANFDPRMPITLTKPNTGSETGKAAVAPLRVKQSVVLRRVRLQKKYCPRCTRTSKSSLT